ncbi:hypothetical protein C8R46DRAFT_1227975 [Mycena filopes]|nr:hypothetical protein C8R46DRAFT_1227975 [Mycena filopes]
MRLGQYSASVAVDGVDLPEYAVEHSADGMEATCWIPSENNKNFSIKLKDTQHSPLKTISGDVVVDGIDCGGRYLRVRGSNGERESTAALTDDDAYLNTAISPDLGTIKVDFALIEPSRKKRERKWYVRDEPRILHERSKKGMGHSVQFGPEYHTRNHATMDGYHILEKLARFKLLRAEGIAPPAPREERVGPPADVIDLSMDADEDDAEEAEIKQLEMKLDALKRKRQPVAVKHEPSLVVKKEIKREGPIFQPGEVIDLT